jgi:D-alanyl-lipoteichoic acid acyltransferase DltB (MBOAT superfamily)
MLASTLASYGAAIGIEKIPLYKGLFLSAGVSVCLAILGVFKYYNFFASDIAAMLQVFGLRTRPLELNLVLPVGISFYTFQAISYVVDVYRGELKPRHDIFVFTLFKMFFPQLTAGPIERGHQLLDQIEKSRVITSAGIVEGIALVIWGYFKKLVIADNLSPIVAKVFALKDPNFPLLWAGVFAFGIQIYADFSAYTDIARGVSRLLGFTLVRNFNHPYFATSPIDFWHRWHISLSNWFRDYVYIPLGGSRRSLPRSILNLFISFGLSGLWHGANWNFIFWGLYHGALVSIQHTIFCFFPRLRGEWSPYTRLPRVVLTFVLVTIGWMMFRETDVALIARNFSLTPMHVSRSDIDIGLYIFALAGIYSLPLWAHGFVDYYCAVSQTRLLEAEPWRWLVPFFFSILLFGILAFGNFDSTSFIYFQF